MTNIEYSFGYSIPPDQAGRVRFVRYIFFAAVLLFLITTPLYAKENAAVKPDPLPISKIHILIHPLSWTGVLQENGQPNPGYLHSIANARGGAWYSEKEFYDILEWESEVDRKQRETIREMRPDEILVIFPSGEHRAMKDLQVFAQEQLGSRCIIIRSPSPSYNRGTDYREVLSEQDKLQGADEILKAVEIFQLEWSAGVLEVLFYSRRIASEILYEFSSRGFLLQPKRTHLVAYGEAFEHCVMSWKAMLPYFLGTEKAVETDYNLSVSGMPLLRSAEFRGRFKMKGDMRLFLWELKDGRPMALFARAQSRMSEKLWYVRLPLKPAHVKAYASDGNLLWPQWRAQNFVVRSQKQGKIIVPVYTGLRMHSSDIPVYIVGNKISFKEFKKKLLSSSLIH